MKITLTDKYITGSDIDLSSKMLGILKQPKLINLIKNNISISSIIDFFVMVEYTHWKLKKDNFGFEPMNRFQVALSLEKEFLENGKHNIDMVNSLSILYDVQIDDIFLESYNDKLSFFIKNRNVIINDDNFDLFMDVVLGMFFITPEDAHKEKEEREWVRNTGSQYEDELIQKFEKRLKKREEEKKLYLSDYINIVVHIGKYTYDYVSSLTYWQLINTLNSLQCIEKYKDMLGYTWSYKFDVKNEENPHWTKEIKLKNQTIEI